MCTACVQFPDLDNGVPENLGQIKTPKFEEDAAFVIKQTDVPNDAAILARIERLRLRAAALRRFKTNFGGRVQSAFQP